MYKAWYPIFFVYLCFFYLVFFYCVISYFVTFLFLFAITFFLCLMFNTSFLYPIHFLYLSVLLGLGTRKKFDLCAFWRRFMTFLSFLSQIVKNQRVHWLYIICMCVYYVCIRTVSYSHFRRFEWVKVGVVRD